MNGTAFHGLKDVDMMMADTWFYCLERDKCIPSI